MVWWDQKSQQSRQNTSLGVPDGRVKLPNFTPNKTCSRPAFWNQHATGMFRLAAESAGSDNPLNGRFVVGINLQEVKKDLYSGLYMYAFEKPIESFSAICIEVDGAPDENSALLLDNIMVDGPVPSMQALDESIKKTQKNMKLAAKPADDVIAAGQLQANVDDFRDEVIWQTSPSIHTPDGTFAGYEKLIPHIKSLGTTIVYFNCLWDSTHYSVGGGEWISH